MLVLEGLAVDISWNAHVPPLPRNHNTLGNSLLFFLPSTIACFFLDIDDSFQTYSRFISDFFLSPACLSGRDLRRDSQVRQAGREPGNVLPSLSSTKET